MVSGLNEDIYTTVLYILCMLFKTFWNLINVATKHDCHDCIGRILSEPLRNHLANDFVIDVTLTFPYFYNKILT